MKLKFLRVNSFSHIKLQSGLLNSKAHLLTPRKNRVDVKVWVEPPVTFLGSPRLSILVPGPSLVIERCHFKPSDRFYISLFLTHFLFPLPSV